MVGFGAILLAAADGQLGHLVGHLAQCVGGVCGLGFGGHVVCDGHTAFGQAHGVSTVLRMYLKRPVNVYRPLFMYGWAV